MRPPVNRCGTVSREAGKWILRGWIFGYSSRKEAEAAAVSSFLPRQVVGYTAEELADMAAVPHIYEAQPKYPWELRIHRYSLTG